MTDETDPAETPEDTTAADPQAEEESAESTEKSEEGSETSEDQGKPEETVDEVEIVIDGEQKKEEEPPKDNAAWAAMRTRERELRAKVAALERQQQVAAQPPQAADPGPEPTLEDCGWDEGTLKSKHVQWLKAKDAQEAEKAKATQQAQKVQQKWEETKATIVKSRDELIKQMPGYKDAEAVVDSALNANQLGIIMRLCKDKTPMVIAALGRDPARLKDLAGEEDVIDFMGKVKELEGKVKMSKKSTPPPPPEKKIGGTGGSSGAVDRTLERLRAQAEKTNNYTEVIRYQRQHPSK